jgi:phage-related protein
MDHGHVAIKPVVWIGTSKSELSKFPVDVKSFMGFALYLAQQGGKHRDAKPLSGFGGAGVMEVVADSSGSTYRAVYTVRLAGPSLCATQLPEKIETRD